MTTGLSTGPSKQHMVIAAVVLLAVSIASAGIYYSFNSSKVAEKEAVKSEGVVAKKSADDNLQSAAITEVTVDPVPVPDAEEQKAASPAPKRVSEKRNRFHSSHNKVAGLFPAPPGISGAAKRGPNETVEMWMGDRRQFISVPAGYREAHTVKSAPSSNGFDETSSRITF